MTAMNATAMPATAREKVKADNVPKFVSCPMVFRCYSPLLDSESDKPAIGRMDLEDHVKEFSIWLRKNETSKLLVIGQSDIEKRSSMLDQERYLQNIAEAVFSLQEDQPEPLSLRMVCTSFRKAVFDVIVEIEAEQFGKKAAADPKIDMYRLSAYAVSEICASRIADYFTFRLAGLLESKPVRAAA